MGIEQLPTSYQALAHSIAEANESAIRQCQEHLKRQLEAIAESAGLKGTLKIDAKWAAATVARKTGERVISRINSIAGNIKAASSFQGANVKQEITDLSATPPKAMKEIAAAMGHKLTGTKSEPMLTELLEKLTGISSVQIDRNLVGSHVQRLTSLYERSVDSLPEKEIKTELKELKKLEIPELACIAEEFGLDRPGKKKLDILKRIEGKITATYKAMTANKI